MGYFAHEILEKIMTDCTLILPHFDDEYCGCRSIVESKEWKVKQAIFVTDSTTQFEPSMIPSEYYEQRLEESQSYLARHQGWPIIRVLDFPEQMWNNEVVRANLMEVLCKISYQKIIFVPYWDDEHWDHRYIGTLFEREGHLIAPESELIYYKVHRIESDPNFRLQHITTGTRWDVEEFKKLYPSQIKQVPSLSTEQYVADRYVPFEFASWWKNENTLSTT